MSTMEINGKCAVKRKHSHPSAAEWDRIDYDYSTLWRMYDSVDAWTGSSQFCVDVEPSLECLESQKPQYTVN